ncbi:MAG: hypothetical protein HY560_00390 [Gemmatimonadetes bacterium]|nr:hypothetical protein [Gemmatimonadota bacterium]
MTAAQFSDLGASLADQRLAEEGSALNSTRDRAWEDFAALRGSRAALLFASAANPAGLQHIGNHTLLPAVRWRLITAIVLGACHNPREEFFGPDPRRRALLDSARVLASDLPRTDEWATLNLRTLDALIDEPAVLRRALRRTRGPLRPLGLVGLGDLADRTIACNRIRRW